MFALIIYYRSRRETGSRDSPKKHGGPAGIRTLDPRLSTRTVPKAYTAARDCVLILVIRTFSSSPNDKML